MLRKLWKELGAALRLAQARREFARLDAAACRDLGISPSEFGSYWAESQGWVERTRLRVGTGRRARPWSTASAPSRAELQRLAC